MENTEAEKPFEAFKVPHLTNPKETVNASNVNRDFKNVGPENVDVKNEQKSVSKNTKPNITKNLIDVPLPYKEPSWSGIPPSLYSFEIIKNGTYVETYNIKTSLVVFGRLDVCNIVFEHPSVSRYHAVIQYCEGDPTHSEGFYLYDLGSTHGTFLNKEKITPKIYYKLKVGYIIKFGGSTRLHIFQGPEQEEEEEKPKPAKVEEEICTWGIGEDAEDEEDLSENPFALSTPNEELYLEDPKKTLRGWFEREGYELEYNVEEKGFKTFACRIQLPIDTPTGDFMAIEASVSGKKKEAVVACALEACRTLDRLGLLRQSHQESRERKKKKWEENDYYDSDEDTFLDRTGTIEKKREMRKRIEKKPEAETFESIETKLKTVTDEICEISSKLSLGKIEVKNVKNAEDDSLEVYMSTLSDSKDMASDKIERRKLKHRLLDAEKEKSRLETLLDIARPAKLPPIAKFPGMIGKKLNSKFKKTISKTPESKVVVPIIKLNENEEEVEEDSDSENTNSAEVASGRTLDSTASPLITENVEIMDEDFERRNKYGLILNVTKEDSKKNIANIESETVSSSKNETVTSNETVTVVMNTSSKHAKSSVSVVKDHEDPPSKKKRKGSHKVVEHNVDVYMKESAEYSTWVPPSGQSGDGITHLNAKYGY